MPPVGLIESLPDEVRADLDRLLAQYRYSKLGLVAKWLEEKGHPISVPTIGRYNKQQKDLYAKAMERAKLRVATAVALGGLSDDEKSALLDSNEMMALDKIGELWEGWDELEPEQRAEVLPKIIRASASLHNAAINTARFRAGDTKAGRLDAAMEVIKLLGEEIRGAQPAHIAEALDSILAAIGPKLAERYG